MVLNQKIIHRIKGIIHTYPRTGAVITFIWHSYNIWVFFNTFMANHLEPSNIDHSIMIPHSSAIRKQGVTICKRTTIGENVVITGRVFIGPECSVSENCVIGGQGFQICKFRQMCEPITHTGKVYINKNVSIGNGSCIDRGFLGKNTIIKSETTIGRYVNIGHNCKIGSHCSIGDGVTIGGNTEIGDHTTIGNHVVISNRIAISPGSVIAPGTIVTRDVNLQSHI